MDAVPFMLSSFLMFACRLSDNKEERDEVDKLSGGKNGGIDLKFYKVNILFKVLHHIRGSLHSAVFDADPEADRHGRPMWRANCPAPICIFICSGVPKAGAPDFISTLDENPP
jgi:hypothetical protein